MKLASARDSLILRSMTPMARLSAACLAAFIAVGPVSAQTASPQATSPQAAGQASASVQAAWARVRAALTPEQQANAVRGFMAALATSEGRRTTPPVDARDIASGRAVSLDDPALLQRPQAHEVTVTVDGQFLIFRPLSRASLEPFFGR